MNENKGKGIVDKIIVLWFIIAFLAIVVSFSLEYTWLSVATFGHLFFGMGIMALVQDVKRKKNVSMSVIFSMVGGLMLVASLFTRFASSEVKQKLISLLEDKSIYLMLSVFILVGILMLYRAYKQAFILPKKYSHSIMATCTELKSIFSESDDMSGSETLYCPVFSYYFNGKEYTACNNEFSNIVRYKKGQQYTINIDPNEHGKYLEDKTNRWIAIVLFLIGVAFVGIGIVFALKIF